MDTSKMQLLKPLNTMQMSKMLKQGETLKEIAGEYLEALDAALLRDQIIDVVESNYDLGKVVDVYEIFGGYVNRSFGIYTEKDGQRHEYFVRKYKKDIQEKEIIFEHKLITYAIENGFDIAAGIYKTKDGRTYVKVKEGDEDRYFAVYRYLPGEDKYTWIENQLTDEEYASSAEVLATYHNSVRDFDPEGFERVEPKIMDLIPMLPPLFKEYASADLNNWFHSYYLRKLDSIIEACNRIRIPAEDLAKMPYIPIHCDFHPGNEKFQDGKVVGLFDFDWSKIDLRLFEIGLGLVYFCSSWVDELDGTLMMRESEIFLRAYQQKLRQLGGLEPLNDVEKKYLDVMLDAGNMYLIYWCLRTYYADPTLNEYEYQFYLAHQVKLMNWIDAHRDEIREMAERI
ncbi:MAG: phosphotransferase [Thermacetogeniaceae bacterium]